MHVAAILDIKGRDVVTLDPDKTLADAARLLAKRSIGTVVVTAGDDIILGILSERDIVRAVATLGAGALEAPVSAHMTRSVKTCAGPDALRSIMERMTAGRFRHMPVIERGRLVGIISIGDVVKSRLGELEAEASAMRDYIASA
ncbi:inosine-5-monophosphate dehydrogenase [Terrihabitans soli]|uniref:Inosine-5-monophosphate dehydrogenase n=1 Tax=Terrihabitans soli TaxID=708113 RepID=A0A6S6QTL5_9HYPH|nr:CBS domain-containing protein [Terrihabitans soli]BCJ91287.1 inosine-5-monophosphate dehydrogenase [Terrihabitans soli]